MKSISASNLIGILKNDPVYFDDKKLMSITDSIAMRHGAHLQFNDRRYGNRRSSRRNSPSSANSNYMFYLYDEALGVEARRINSIIDKGLEIGGDLMECIAAKNALLKKLGGDARTQLEFLLTMLATEMEFLYEDKILALNAEGLRDLILNQYDGCALEVLKVIVLRDVGIEKYFQNNRLPLPVTLYPKSVFNSDIFAKSFQNSAWDGHEIYDDFVSFYRDRSVKNENAESASPRVDVLKDPCVDNGFGCGSEPQPSTVNNMVKSSHAFYRSGNGWLIRFEGREHFFSDKRGFLYMHEILKAGCNGISPINLEFVAKGSPVVDKEDRLFFQIEKNLTTTSLQKIALATLNTV